MKLIATRSQRYDGRRIKKDEEFEATDKHARILKIMRKAVDAPEAPEAPATSMAAHSLRTAPALAQTRTRAIEAEEEPTRQAKKPRAKAKDEKPVQKRAYKRRDMRAED